MSGSELPKQDEDALGYLKITMEELPKNRILRWWSYDFWLFRTKIKAKFFGFLVKKIPKKYQ